jgi:aryl-phospho-beta-D-glucosidase BglC (GH1 family)
MKTSHFKYILAGLFFISIAACKKTKNEAPQLSVSASTITFLADGGTQDISISGNADWSINNPAYSWLQLSATSGNSGSTVIQLTTLSENSTGATRSVILYISSSNGQARRVTVTQAPTIYPGYNTSPKAPDMTGMTSTAVQLAAKMRTGMGINFGNTMESPGEGDWQNSKLTESYVKFVKQQGFNSVRIPCGWLTYHSSDQAKAKIDPAWLNRVKEVVGWCVANDMYVMLNVHGDWGWLEDNVNTLKKDSVNAKQKALWEQIATTMRDFDEHLIFASTNEPKADNAGQMTILNGYHQTFINAVRSTGGRNSYRVLVVQGPHTDPSKTNDLMNTLPTDKIPNKLMVEVHDYTPAVFTILGEDVSWGNMVYYWGAGNHSTIEPERNATFGEEDAIVAEFKKMKEKFVDKGIPVILGEYASMRRTTGQNVPKDLAMHNKSVDYWATFATKTAKVNGLLPFWWEVGNMFDRANNVIKDQALYDALKEGYK